MREREVTPALPLRQRLIGTTLRRYREDAGYDLQDAARTLGCDRSKISRIEAGERGIRLAELRKLLSEYGTGEPARDTLEALAQATRGGWWQDYRQILSAGYIDLLIVENIATEITIYAPLQVPELLHTEDYAKAVALAVSRDKEIADTAVAATMARQRAVFHERGTTVAVVLGEAALRQQVGGADVLRAQLRHLARLGRGGFPATIQVVPFTAGAHGANGGFAILQFGPALPPGLVVVDGPGDGGIYLDAPESVTAYAGAFSRLQDLAPSPHDSARMLRGGRP
jgi:transcriptional regulator with XRE-family HTH domain